MLEVVTDYDDKLDALPERSQVVDMHCHVAGIGAGGSGAFLSHRLRRSWKYRVYLRAFGVTEEALLRYGDGLVVERIAARLQASAHVGGAIVLALDGQVDRAGKLAQGMSETYIPNDFVATEVARYDNLYFGASVNPYRRDALQRLDRVKAAGAVLVKWLPSVQAIDPADHRLVPFYNKLVELDLPLLTHAGAEEAFTCADNRFGDPHRLHLPLQLGVRVIAAHAATTGKSEGEDNMQRLLPMLKSYDNLYADISALTQVNKVRFLPRLLAAGVDAGKLLYGTDFPLITTGLTLPIFSALHVNPLKAAALTWIDNPWDQDVQLKRAHGVPNDVFLNSKRLLIK